MPLSTLGTRALARLSRSAVLHRWTEGEYVEGKWYPGTESPYPIKVVLQEPPPKGLAPVMDEPTGQRMQSEGLIWTTTMLRAADEEAGQKADEIEIAGERWRVMQISRRTEGGFYRAMVARVRDRGRSGHA